MFARHFNTNLVLAAGSAAFRTPFSGPMELERLAQAVCSLVHFEFSQRQLHTTSHRGGGGAAAQITSLLRGSE